MRQVPQPVDALVNLLHTVAHSRLVRLQSKAHHSDASPVADLGGIAARPLPVPQGASD